MKSRRIIRDLFLGIAFCIVVVWIASYWYEAEVMVRYSSTNGVQLMVFGGECIFMHGESVKTKRRWGFVVHPDVPGRTAATFRVLSTYPIHGLGFGVASLPPFIVVALPLWFPAAALLLAYWVMRRKTRPVSRPFPVEASQPSTAAASLKSQSASAVRGERPGEE